jgi:glutamyl-tRNA synthetase
MRALGAKLPKFAHVPMILGADGKRLSKRHGAVSVMQYRDDGFMPEALLNYLVRLGWSHGDQEIFSREEMIELFSLEGINKAPSAFNVEKSIWLNQHYLKELPVGQVAEQMQWHLDNQGIDTTSGPAITDVIDALKERAKTLVDLTQSCRYFYQDVDEYDEKAAKKQFKEHTPEILQALHDELSGLDSWEGDAIHQAIVDVCEKLDLKLGKVGPPLRVAVTGTAMSPSLDVTLKLIGRERSLQRILDAIEFIQNRESI